MPPAISPLFDAFSADAFSAIMFAACLRRDAPRAATPRCFCASCARCCRRHARESAMPRAAPARSRHAADCYAMPPPATTPVSPRRCLRIAAPRCRHAITPTFSSPLRCAVFHIAAMPFDAFAMLFTVAAASRLMPPVFFDRCPPLPLRRFEPRLFFSSYFFR